jgi:hypothetical protein
MQLIFAARRRGNRPTRYRARVAVARDRLPHQWSLLPAVQAIVAAPLSGHGGLRLIAGYRSAAIGDRASGVARFCEGDNLIEKALG